MHQIIRQPLTDGSRGLTVLEILIGLAALAIIAMLVVPNAHTAYYERKVRDTSEILVESLTLAQAEASNRGGIARLCPSSNGKTCRANNDWHMGWVLFFDGNGDGQVQEFEYIDAVEITDSRIEIQAVGSVAAAASFSVVGLVEPGADDRRSSADGEFRICFRDSSAQGRRVLIEPDGWVIDERLSREVCNPPDAGA
jgi:type IV fimbrial biogenesis protein FimT